MTDVTERKVIGQGRTAEVVAWNEDQVLKLFRSWCPADWADEEARVARAVHATGLAVPAVGGVIELDGRRGILYQRVEGDSMLERLSSRPWTLLRSARRLAELHAAMHARVVPGLPSQRQRLRAKIHAARPLPADWKRAALDALDRLPDAAALCHGDFHPDNVLVSPQGPVIIDWPDATQGHPLADVSRTLLLMRAGGLPEGTARRWLIRSLRATYRALYLRRYFRLRAASGSREQLVAWQLPVTAARLSEDIPEERERVLAMVEASLPR